MSASDYDVTEMKQEIAYYKEKLADAQIAYSRCVRKWQPIETAPKEPEWTSGRHQHGRLILAYPVGHRVDTVYWWQTTDTKTSNFLDGGGNAAHPTH